MNEEEKKEFIKRCENIGFIVGKYGTKEEISAFETVLEDYKTKGDLVKNQQKVIIKKDKIINRLAEEFYIKENPNANIDNLNNDIQKMINKYEKMYERF